MFDETKGKALINEIKSVIQDCNINFLLGSGLSSPYLSLLGEVERLLTELSYKKEKEEVGKDQEKIIRAFLYKKFFDKVISKNVNILEKSDDKVLNETLENYKTFIKLINTIILNRRSSILSRQINLFTTNFDIFLEKSMEMLGVEYNDGFSGHFNSVFNLSNFKKSFFKRSLHYDNIYELPVFNLLKIHGSLTWKKKTEEENIYFDKDLQVIKNIKKIQISNKHLIFESVKQKLFKNCQNTIKDLIFYTKDKKLSQNIEDFIKEYEKLSIINPTKEKFKETILNRNHYELLRIYSTELERENTVLFVMGFSFEDEHIRDLTVRVANSNPTLKIYVFAYSEKAKSKIEKNINKSKPNNQNIQIISPIELNANNKTTTFNLSNINKKVFNNLLKDFGNRIEKNNSNE